METAVRLSRDEPRARPAHLARLRLLSAHSRFNIAIGRRHAVEVCEHLPILLRISLVCELTV